MQLLQMRTLRDWDASHPEWWCLSISGAAWLMLLFRAWVPGVTTLCIVRSDGIPSHVASRIAADWNIGTLSNMAFNCMVMTFAMVPVLAVPPIRHIAVRSFATRRHAAIATFLAAASFPWIGFGFASLLVLEILPRSWSSNPTAAACGFLIAAIWQITAAKRLALRHCYRTVSLAPAGWRAAKDSAWYGFAYGRVCVASCWAMMFATMLASHSLFAELCVQFIALSERRLRLQHPRMSAGVLISAAVAALYPAFVSFISTGANR